MSSLIAIIESIILGIIEGLTEFLPVSSTGHLVIAEKLMNFDKYFDNDFITIYTYVIQLGAILAVVILYRNRIRKTIKYFNPAKVGFHKSGLRFWLTIVVACIPGAICEFTVGDYIEEKFFTLTSVAISLIIGAILMIVVENIFSSRLRTRVYDITFSQAFIIGLFQCLAIFPGMSRSASTIIGGFVCGLSAVVAAEYSFFLAIPVMLGMSLLKLRKLFFLDNITFLNIAVLVIGFVVSFIVALIVIKAFIDYLKRHKMQIFAYYRIVFAILVLIYTLVAKI